MWLMSLLDFVDRFIVSPILEGIGFVCLFFAYACCLWGR